MISEMGSLKKISPTTREMSGSLVCPDLVYAVMGERKERLPLRLCNHSPDYIRVGNSNIFHLCGLRNLKPKNKMASR